MIMRQITTKATETPLCTPKFDCFSNPVLTLTDNAQSECNLASLLTSDLKVTFDTQLETSSDRQFKF